MSDIMIQRVLELINNHISSDGQEKIAAEELENIFAGREIGQLEHRGTMEALEDAVMMLGQLMSSNNSTYRGYTNGLVGGLNYVPGFSTGFTSLGGSSGLRSFLNANLYNINRGFYF